MYKDNVVLKNVCINRQDFGWSKNVGGVSLVSSVKMFFYAYSSLGCNFLYKIAGVGLASADENIFESYVTK